MCKGLTSTKRDEGRHKTFRWGSHAAAHDAASGTVDLNKAAWQSYTSDNERGKHKPNTKIKKGCICHGSKKTADKSDRIVPDRVN